MKLLVRPRNSLQQVVISSSLVVVAVMGSEHSTDRYGVGKTEGRERDRREAGREGEKILEVSDGDWALGRVNE